MPQCFTLHTHTLGCDGKNTIAEMVARATEIGMTAIGISNHFIVHPRIQESNFYPYSVRGGYNHIYCSSFLEILTRFVPIFDELEQVAAKSSIRVLRGFEVDWFPDPNWQREFAQAMRILRPDYLIGASHFVEVNGIPNNVHDIAHADRSTQQEMLTQYWNKICAASQSGLFTFMAHLDLPRKVGLGTDETWMETERQAIAQIASHGTPIEINTGLYPEPYPSRRILEHIAAHNIPVLISDDAHNVDQIGRHFADAERLIGEVGIKNRISLQKLLDFSNKSL